MIQFHGRSIRKEERWREKKAANQVGIVAKLAPILRSIGLTLVIGWKIGLVHRKSKRKDSIPNSMAKYTKGSSYVEGDPGFQDILRTEGCGGSPPHICPRVSPHATLPRHYLDNYRGARSILSGQHKHAADSNPPPPPPSEQHTPTIL